METEKKEVLTGIGKIYNATKYDFPLYECIRSVLDGADYFILVVCTDSEDNTVDVCRELEIRFAGKLILIYDKWRLNDKENYTNMARLANKAIDAVKTPWFASIDMDEIIPAGEMNRLRELLIKQPDDVSRVWVKLNHLFINNDYQLLGHWGEGHDRVARVKRGWMSIEDGFGIGGSSTIDIKKNISIKSDIEFNHYGCVRDMKVQREKEIRFQKELYSTLDERLKYYGDSAYKFYLRFMGPTGRLMVYQGKPHHSEALAKYGAHDHPHTLLSCKKAEEKKK